MEPRKALKLVMGIYGWMYSIFAGVVLFFEDFVYRVLDLQQSIIGIGVAAGGPPPVSVWKYVALGLITMLAFISFWAARDPERHKVGVQLMIYNKFVSGGLMIVHFALAGSITAFLIAGLSDLAMGVIAWVALARAFSGTTKDILRFRPLVE